ncbi:MAG: nuclear transport factor 2 family protein [Deltaproteobacteria bacterium]|nr:nuclear transport factor 2 family protein [Deltaproteobacteria bacterium]
MKKMHLIVALAVSLGLTAPAMAKHTATHTQVDGKKLEKQFWTNLQTKNWQAIDTALAPGFQSIHTDGTRTRDQELSLMKNLKINKYKLNKFDVTESKDGDTMVISYKATTKETIDNNRLATRESPRMSVWHKTDTGWKMISHTNVTPVK